LALALGAALVFLRPASEQSGIPAAARPTLGLMTSLPIYWPEAESPGDFLAGGKRPHWARMALERDYVLRPLDTLTQAGGLQSVYYLLLAQPRALSGEENVALDDWVRGGGCLLLFADPMLTGHSIFAIGDRRRPQDVVLLSPILARWGLELGFDEGQGGEVAVRRVGDLELPTQRAGAFRLRKPAGGAAAECRLLADGLAAQCAIGEGRVLAIADAALLEDGDEEGGRAGPLMRLAGKAFSGS